MRRAIQTLIVLTVVSLIIIILNPMHKHGLRDDAKIAYEYSIIKRLSSDIYYVSQACMGKNEIEFIVLDDKKIILPCKGFPKKISVKYENNLQLTNNADGSHDKEYPLGLFLTKEDLEVSNMWITEELPNGQVKIMGPASLTIYDYIESKSFWLYDPDVGKILFYQNGIESEFY